MAPSETAAVFVDHYCCCRSDELLDIGLHRPALKWVSTCLVPRPQYFAAVNRFRVTWSDAKLQAVRLAYIRHQNQLTVKAWEKAVKEIGKVSTTIH